MNMKKTLLAAAATALLLPAASFAAEPGFYFGGKIGASSSGQNAFDDADTSYGLYGGYRFNQFFALEGEFTDFGNIEVDLSDLDFNNTRTQPRSWGMRAVGFMPINPNFDLMANIGHHSFDLNPRDDQGFRQVIGRSSSSDWTYGLGAQFNFANSLSLRTNYQRYEFREAGRSDEISLGLHYRF